MVNIISDSRPVSGNSLSPVQKKGKYSCCLCKPLFDFALKVGRAVRLFFLMVLSWLGFSKKTYEPEIQEEFPLRGRLLHPRGARYRPSSSGSSGARSAPPVEVPSTTPSGKVLISPLGNSGNSCFLSGASHLLMNDPRIREALDILDRKPVTQMPGDVQSNISGENQLKALQLVISFFNDYRVAERENKPFATASKLRDALSCLSPKRFPWGDRGQRDAHEALVYIRPLILKALLVSSPEEKNRLFPDVICETIATLSCSQELIDEAQQLFGQDSRAQENYLSLFDDSKEPDVKKRLRDPKIRVIDAAQRIFKQGLAPERKDERFEVEIVPKLNFIQLIQNFLSEDSTKHPPQDRIFRKENWRYVEKNFLFDSKKTVFESAPSQMVVTMKRFGNVQTLNQTRLQKIEGRIEGVTAEIKLSADHFLDGNEARFRLDTVVLHHGSTMSGGHYTTLVRKEEEGHCYYLHCDDLNPARPAQLSCEEFLERAKKEGYIFVYTKI